MAIQSEVSKFEDIQQKEDEIKFLARLYVQYLKEISEIQEKIDEIKHSIYR